MRIDKLATAMIAVGALAMGGPAGAGETTGLTDTTIKVGVMGPFTGNASSYSKTQIGLMAYFQHINDQGGIHGRKFEMIPEDTACAPAKGIAAAKKLVHQDEVFYLHGNSCSAVAMAVKPTVEPTGTPWIIAHAVNPKISMPVTENRNIFHGVPAGPAYGSTMGEFVRAGPAPSASRWSPIPTTGRSRTATPPSRSSRTPAARSSRSWRSNAGQTDATAQVLKLKQANPDFILGCLYEAETVIFLRDAKKYGVRVPVMGTAGRTWRTRWSGSAIRMRSRTTTCCTRSSTRSTDRRCSSGTTSS